MINQICHGFCRLAVASFLFAFTLSSSLLAQELKEAPLVKELDELRELSSKIVGMSERAVEATVCLMAPNGGGAGSGVVISEEGLILTAAHVVDAIGDDVVVIFNDGTRKKGKSLGADFNRDAAMVKITDKGEYTYVDFGSSKDLLKNQWVVAIGHPGGFDPTRTAPLRLGRVLSNGRFITTDSAVVGGDSGGPLFNIHGEVIGIHSNIGASLSENRHVPLQAYRDYWKEMQQGERKGNRFGNRFNPNNPNRAVMGVGLGPETDDGVPITSVGEGSPGQKAGLKEGDIITAIDKKSFKSRDKLIEAVSRRKPGQTITVVVLRDGDRKEFKVKLARLADLLRAQQQGQQNNGQRQRRNQRPQQAEDNQGEKNKDDDGAAFAPRAQPIFVDGLLVYFDETKADDKKKQEKDKQAEAEKDDLDKFLDKALKFKNGRPDLRLNRAAIEKFGLRNILKRARERAKEAGIKIPDAPTRQTAPDNFFMSTIKALEPVTKKAESATVSVLVNDKPVALGTIVAGDGLIITKNTETKDGGDVTILVGKDKLKAELVKRFAKRDLAVFRVERKDLTPVAWADDSSPAPVGSVLTIPNEKGQPIGIGLVSVLARTMSKIGFLGVGTSGSPKGIVVQDVRPGASADKAGLKRGDIITAVNGKKFNNPVDFRFFIQKFRAGDKLDVDYLRNEESKKVELRLSARSFQGQTAGRARAMNEMSGPLSALKGGFPEALQHDIPILPSHCGGPLLDLDGKCVGINVSRAGRVKTYAVPVGDIHAMLAEIK